MTKKLALFLVFAFLAVPFASLAQSTGKSIASLNVADVAEHSIVVLSKEDTGVPGYVRQQYAVNCSGDFQVVDYYGPSLDPNDQSIILTERRMCAKISADTDDSDGN